MEIGEASTTARGVAAYRMTFDRVATEYGFPADDQRLQEHVAADVEPPPTSMTRYLRARTEFIDRAVVDAIAIGVGQVVSVGAGYDGRFRRYAAPGVRWFEIDHPDTQADKLARLAHLGIDVDGVGFAAADFAVDNPGDELIATGLEAALPTLFICEGVTGYLDVPTIAALLGSLGACAGNGSRLAVEIPLRPERPDDAARRAALQTTVASLGEPLVGAVDRNELVDFVSATGWTVVDAVDARGVPLVDGARGTVFVSAVVVSRR